MAETCCNCGNDDGVYCVCFDCLAKIDDDGTGASEEVIDYYSEASLFGGE